MAEAIIKGYSVAQILAAEAPHRAAGEPLMFRAAAALAAEIRSLLSSSTRPQSRSVVLLVGAGDNGGDALYAGAELATTGIDVHVVATASRMHVDGRAAAENAGALFYDYERRDASGLLALAGSASVVVDGILGTGTSSNPALRGSVRDVVELLRPVVEASDGPVVVAVDIPSGIGPDDGAVPDPAVLPADVTVTFGGCKVGLLLPPASAYAGRIVVVDIGTAAELGAMTPVRALRHAV